MIILWGIIEDVPLRDVFVELQKLSADVRFIDQRECAPGNFRFTFGHTVGGQLATGEGVLDLDQVSAVYLRPHDFRLLPQLEGIDETNELWLKTAHFNETMSLWCEETPALVVNRPSASASNLSKPYQLEIILQSGFSVPDTIITTDPEFARQFSEKHGQIIYKSISGVRSIVSRLSEADGKRLADVVWCPTQFQEYVPGTDYRVHVVGGEVFSCRITSEADDYRYSPLTRIVECAVPDEVAEKCLQLAGQLRLSFAGIDLRLTPDGEWFCFEANPSPGFSYFERSAGLAIGAAVARMLAGGNLLTRGPKKSVRQISADGRLCLN